MAFIEIAWRRYTKHSRAKAQEIQGAVLPLLERYADTRPFAGVVVAGAWTPQALEQLRTSGFALAHVPYQEIVAAFGRVGLDVDASERTQDAQLAEQVAQYEALPLGRRGSLVKAVQGVLHAGMTIFLLQLETAVRRRIECVVILPLYGCGVTFTSLPDAIASLREAPGLPPAQARWLRVEVSVRFSNGDEVRGSFQNPEHAVDFLNRQAQD